MNPLLTINCQSAKICTKTVTTLIISVLLLSSPYFCQGSTEINGKVIDKQTGQPILGASVKIESDDQTLAETTTRKDGSFGFTQSIQGENQIQGELNRL